MNVCFDDIKYAKRPYTIYIDEDEYTKRVPHDVSFMNVYHRTQYGPFYVGKYRYKSSYKGIITLRRLPFSS